MERIEKDRAAVELEKARLIEKEKAAAEIENARIQADAEIEKA